jgi:hypothetical protein
MATAEVIHDQERGLNTAGHRRALSKIRTYSFERLWLDWYGRRDCRSMANLSKPLQLQSLRIVA